MYLTYFANKSRRFHGVKCYCWGISKVFHEKREIIIIIIKWSFFKSSACTLLVWIHWTDQRTVFILPFFCSFFLFYPLHLLHSTTTLVLVSSSLARPLLIIQSPSIMWLLFAISINYPRPRQIISCRRRIATPTLLSVQLPDKGRQTCEQALKATRWNWPRRIILMICVQRTITAVN